MILLRIVTTNERPELAEVTGVWRWNAFFRKDGFSLDEVMARERACASDSGLLPSVLVLLKDDTPIGMVALCDDDLEGRPELNPWLAGMFVVPEHRERGYARKLIGALEDFARENGIEHLSLYTETAVDLYLKCGWRPLDTFPRDAKTFTLMRKRL